MVVEELNVAVGGTTVRCLAAGEGPPLLLLHALGENASDWRWALPALARARRVYAPDLPGFGEKRMPGGDYSACAFTGFFEGFLDVVGAERAAVVGNSLGGLMALRMALSFPPRVSALGLVGSTGLGREISLVLKAPTIPGLGEAAVAWGKTPPGAAQQALGRASLLFADRRRVPRGWTAEQRRLARKPGFLEAALAALRANVDLGGQREVLSGRLPELRMPTLVLWGESDAVVPLLHAREAAARLERGVLSPMPRCGHLPQAERPDLFAAVLGDFLREHDQSRALERE